MPDSGELVRVHVDFNDMDTTGRFFVLQDDASGELLPNSQVTLHDAEGNSAQGRVVELQDQAAVVAMTPGSWQHGPVVPTRMTASFEELVAKLITPSILAGSWQCQLTMTPSEMVGQSALTYASPQLEGAVPSSL